MLFSWHCTSFMEFKSQSNPVLTHSPSLSTHVTGRANQLSDRLAALHLSRSLSQGKPGQLSSFTTSVSLTKVKQDKCSQSYVKLT